MNAVHQGESSPLLPPKAPAQGGWVRKAVIGTCVVAGCVAALAASSGALSAGAAPVASRTHPLGARSGKTVKARVNKSAPNLFESKLGHDGHEYPGTEGCESICEGEDIDEATCDTMFFCQWDTDDHGHGRCWSKVGTKPCPDTREQLEDIMIWRGEDHDDYVHKDADYRNHHPHNGEDGYEPAEDGHRSGYDTEETEEGWGIHVPGIHVDMPCNPATDDDCHPLEDAVNAVEEGAEAAGTAVADGAEAVGDGVVNTVEDPVGAIEDAGEAVAEGAEAAGEATVEGAEAAGSAVAEGAEAAGTAVAEGAEAAGEAAEEAGEAAAHAAEDAAHSVEEAGADMAAKADAATKPLTEPIAVSTKPVTDAIADGAEAVEHGIEDAGKAISDAAVATERAVEEGLEKVGEGFDSLDVFDVVPDVTHHHHHDEEDEHHASATHDEYPHDYPGTEGCEATCEGHEIDEIKCWATMGCEFDEGQCWSAVGPNPCPGSHEELVQSMFEHFADVHGDHDEDEHHDDVIHHVDFLHDYPGTQGCEVTCEGHDYDEDKCNSMFYCEFDEGKCWSKVGPNPCPGTPGEMETELEMWDSDGDGAVDERGVYPAMDVVHEDYTDHARFDHLDSHIYPGDQGCEAKCEGISIEKDQCEGMLGCEYDEGKCWSAVGGHDCPSSEREFEEWMHDGTLDQDAALGRRAAFKNKRIIVGTRAKIVQMKQGKKA